MSEERDPKVQELLDKLMGSQEDGDNFIMVGGDGQPGPLSAAPAPESQDPSDVFEEGQPVVIAGTLLDGKTLSIEGVVCGVAPIIGPMGPIGFDYVVRVLNPEVLPTTEDGKPYPYSCVTAPPHLVTKNDEPK